MGDMTSLRQNGTSTSLADFLYVGLPRTSLLKGDQSRRSYYGRPGDSVAVVRQRLEQTWTRLLH